jgi:WhiB family transcriptional regulator, redox-sensing transcriptional regulator
MSRPKKQWVEVDDLWRKYASCRTMFPSFFHPENRWQADIAVRICESCPVLEQCRKYAEINKPESGVWGARIYGKMTRDRQSRERRHLRVLQTS